MRIKTKLRDRPRPGDGGLYVSDYKSIWFDVETYDESRNKHIELGLMTATGIATDRCQWTECGEVFSTCGNFDRHRRGDDCLPPATVA
jgi:hypothetical protein